jgi:hypothetical protein
VGWASMKAPDAAYDDELGKSPQPAHMGGYVQTFADIGGMHINSGIPHHAFHLAATQLGGYAWEHAGRRLEEVLRRRDGRRQWRQRWRQRQRTPAALGDPARLWQGSAGPSQQGLPASSHRLFM